MQTNTGKTQAMSLGRRLNLFLQRYVKPGMPAPAAMTLEGMEARQMMSAVPTYIGGTAPIEVVAGNDLVLNLNTLFADDGALTFSYTLSGTKSITNQTLVTGQNLTGGVLTLNTQSQENGNLKLVLNALDGDGQKASAPLTLEIHGTQGVNLDGQELIVSSISTSTASFVAPKVAALAEGGFVNVWSVPGQGVYARIFDEADAPLGSAFLVAANKSFYSDDKISVAGLSGGGFVVAYADYVLEPTLSINTNQLFVKHFDATGTLQGSAQRVPITVASENRKGVGVTALADNGFAVTWLQEHAIPSATAYTPKAQLFDAAGPIGSAIDIAGVDTQANSVQAAKLEGNRFVVTWEAFNNTYGAWDMSARVFGVNGTPVTSTIIVGSRLLPSSQLHSDVTALEGGGFAVAWSQMLLPAVSPNLPTIHWRVYGADYEAVVGHTPITFTPALTGPTFRPSLTMLKGGGFVMSWLSGTSFMAQAYDAKGITVGAAFKINANNPTGVTGMDLATLADGRLVAYFMSNLTSSQNTVAQIFTFNDRPSLASVPRIVMHQNAAPLDVDLSAYFADDVSSSKDLVYTLVSSSNLSLFDVEMVSDAVMRVTLSPDAIGMGTAVVKVADETGYWTLATLGLWSVATPGSALKAVGPTLVANQFAAGELDTDSDVAVASDGSYVITWEHRDVAGNTAGKILGRRVGADGVALGNEFVVNSSTAVATRVDPSVSVAPDGSFVVTWMGINTPSPSGPDVFARRFDAAGNPLGDEFIVNTTTQSVQQAPSVSHDAAGGFVVAWVDSLVASPSLDRAVRGQRFDAQGTRIGGEIQLGTIPNTAANGFMGTAVDPGDGSSVTLWTWPTADLFIRRSTYGSTSGPLIDVASTTGTNTPSVAIAGNGSFVAVWAKLEGSDGNVYLQRFDASGAPADGVLTVNAGTGRQVSPDVGMAADGTFTVSWAETSEDSSTFAVYIQRYAPDGTPIGTPELVSGATETGTANSHVTVAPGGQIVVSWDTKDAASNYEIRSRLYTLEVPFELEGFVAVGEPAPLGVGSVDVQFSQAVDIASFNWESIVLTHNDGANLVTEETALTLTLVSGSTYRISGFAGLTNKAGSYTLALVDGGVTDEHGNVLATGGETSWSVVLSTPSTPALAAGSQGVPGSGYTPSVTPAVVGTGMPGSTVQIYEGSTLRGSGVVDAEGHYEIVLGTLANGAHTLKARTTDGFGAVSSDSAAVTIQVVGTAPTVSTLTTFSTPRTTPVTSVSVRFTAAAENATFTWEDIALTLNGGANLATSAIIITQSASDPTLYTISIPAALTDDPGVYQLTVNGAGINSLANRAYSNNKSTTWTMQAMMTSITTYSAPRTTALTSTSVTFGTQIDAATFNWEDITLTLNGGANLATSGITITQSATNPLVYVINLPAALTDDPGVYQLTVTGAGIQTVSGVAFMNNVQTSWTMQAKINAITAYSAPRTAALTSTSVTFGTQINPATFTWEDITLTRDGGANLVTSGITITQSATNPLVYVINLPTDLTDDPGTYQLTVAGAGIQAVSGAAFINDVQTSWIMQAKIAGMTSYSTPRTTALTSTSVTFGTQIDVSTFTWEDIVLTLNGGANIATSDITIRQSTTNPLNYVIYLPASLTDDPGTYQLTVNGATIQTVSGAPFINDGQTSWVMEAKITSMPAYTTPRTAALTSTTVKFGTQIDASSFTWEDIVLTRDGGANLATSAITITTTPNDPLIRIIYFPATMTGDPGSYDLTVLGAGIQTVSGVPFANDGHTSWVMQAKIMSMMAYPTPRTIALTSMTITFGTQINVSSFNWQDIVLTLNGGANLATSAITITQSTTNPLSFVIGLPSSLSLSAGVYQLTVLGSGIETLSGAATFSNDGQTTWTKV